MGLQSKMNLLSDYISVPVAFVITKKIGKEKGTIFQQHDRTSHECWLSENQWQYLMFIITSEIPIIENCKNIHLQGKNFIYTIVRGEDSRIQHRYNFYESYRW